MAASWTQAFPDARSLFAAGRFLAVPYWNKLGTRRRREFLYQSPRSGCGYHVAFLLVSVGRVPRSLGRLSLPAVQAKDLRKIHECIPAKVEPIGSLGHHHALAGKPPRLHPRRRVVQGPSPWLPATVPPQ